ncbi:DMT family transporter [Gordonia jinhuaensis]|nr:SMR family transporter [Gordonia jinhuaensis]
MGWVLLAIAIASEVVGTLAMRAAVSGSPWWYLLTAIGYTAAFILLPMALRTGMPVGLSYAVWASAGIVATAILAHFLFGERFTVITAAGIILITAGVAAIQSQH